MSDSWNYTFLWRALAAGLLLSVTAGVLSPFVVLRRLSFSSDGLAHASLGGLAAGLYLTNSGTVPSAASYAISFAFTCLVALAMAYFSAERRLQSDTAIGACYVAAFSVGIVLLSLRKRHSGHLEHFFFGSLLAVNSLECFLLAALALATLAFILTHWHWLAQWTFDEELAAANGVHLPTLRYATTLLIAATVILATRVVGVLLVTALLILPGATATLLSSTLSRITTIALVTAAAGVTSGLVASNHSNVPPGPTMVLVLFSLFVAAWIFHRASHHRRSLPVPNPISNSNSNSTTRP